MDETKKSFNIDYKELEELLLKEIELIEKRTESFDFDKKQESLKEKIIKEYEKKLLLKQANNNNEHNEHNAIMNVTDFDALMGAFHIDEQHIFSDEDRENISTYLAERIDAYILFGSLKKMNLCQRFFSKTHNKSFENALSILKILIDEQLLSCDLYKQADLDLLTKLLINDALKILRCNDLVKKIETISKVTNKVEKVEYEVPQAEWFNGARHIIKDIKILKYLAKPLLSFVRVNIHDKPSDFFYIISELIEYIIQNSIAHNENLRLEKAIYKTIASSNSMKIVIKATGKSIEIEPYCIDIVFDKNKNNNKNKNKKVLIYSRIGETSKRKYHLEEIELPAHDIYDQALPSITSNFLTFKMETKPKKVEKINVILAVNSLLYEYFTNIDVFEEMEIITDLTYIETLQMEYIKKNRAEFNKLILTHDSVTPSADFFLLKIRDEHDFIAQEIQKNLQYIKIIHPLSMEESIIESMTIFYKNKLL